MEAVTEYKMKKGTVLATVNGFVGEEDFYRMHDIIKSTLQPEDSGYSVDSMCIGGYFQKDGISVRTSSESPYDTLSFFYDPRALSEEETAKVRGWIRAVADAMHRDPQE